MIEIFLEALVTNGILGIVCAFFMWKEVKKDNLIVKSLNNFGTELTKVATVIDERIPKK